MRKPPEKRIRTLRRRVELALRHEVATKLLRGGSRDGTRGTESFETVGILRGGGVEEELVNPMIQGDKSVSFQSDGGSGKE